MFFPVEPWDLPDGVSELSGRTGGRISNDGPHPQTGAWDYERMARVKDVRWRGGADGSDDILPWESPAVRLEASRRSEHGTDPRQVITGSRGIPAADEHYENTRQMLSDVFDLEIPEDVGPLDAWEYLEETLRKWHGAGDEDELDDAVPSDIESDDDETRIPNPLDHHSRETGTQALARRFASKRPVFGRDMSSADSDGHYHACRKLFATLGIDLPYHRDDFSAWREISESLGHREAIEGKGAAVSTLRGMASGKRERPRLERPDNAFQFSAHALDGDTHQQVSAVRVLTKMASRGGSCAGQTR